MSTSEHTHDCVGEEPCAPVIGQWLQPDGHAVAAITEQFPDTPWCQVRAMAWELLDA